MKINAVDPQYPWVSHPWIQPTAGRTGIFNPRLEIHRYKESTEVICGFRLCGAQLPNTCILPGSTVLQYIFILEDIYFFLLKDFLLSKIVQALEVLCYNLCWPNFE